MISFSSSSDDWYDTIHISPPPSIFVQLTSLRTVFGGPSYKIVPPHSNTILSIIVIACARLLCNFWIGKVPKPSSVVVPCVCMCGTVHKVQCLWIDDTHRCSMIHPFIQRQANCINISKIACELPSTSSSWQLISLVHHCYFYYLSSPLITSIIALISCSISSSTIWGDHLCTSFSLSRSSAAKLLCFCFVFLFCKFFIFVILYYFKTKREWAPPTWGSQQRIRKRATKMAPSCLTWSRAPITTTALAAAAPQWTTTNTTKG